MRREEREKRRESEESEKRRRYLKPSGGIPLAASLSRLRAGKHATAAALHYHRRP